MSWFKWLYATARDLDWHALGPSTFVHEIVALDASGAPAITLVDAMSFGERMPGLNHTGARRPHCCSQCFRGRRGRHQ